jgi:hypothetical protein
MRDIFSILASLSVDNNPCKAQMLKGDGLYHLVRLLERSNRNCFAFLVNITDSEENIAAFVEHGLLEKLLIIYENHIFQIAYQLDDLKGNCKVSKWLLLITLNKFISKLF